MPKTSILKAKMREGGLSQRKLAEEVMSSARTINLFCQRGYATEHIINKVAGYFQVEPQDIIGFVDPAPASDFDFEDGIRRGNSMLSELTVLLEKMKEESRKQRAIE